MNIGKTRVVRVLDDKYSEIIRQLKDNTEEEVKGKNPTRGTLPSKVTRDNS